MARQRPASPRHPGSVQHLHEHPGRL